MSETALVVGFGGRSGVAAVNFLLKNGYMVIANDIKKEETLQEYIEKVKEPDRVRFILGHHKTDILEGVTLVVLSPGVPSNIDIIRTAKEKGISVISEVELGFRYHPENWICITGTDGKSTTTSLIGNIIKLKYPDSIIGGNLGIPITDLIMNAKKETFVVAELSSFQLENIVDLKPRIGVLINIARDHLDRYDSFDEYVEAKLNLFKNQTEDDFSVFNKDNKLLMEWLGKRPVRSKRSFFSLAGPVDDGACLEDGSFVFYSNKVKEVLFQDGEQQIEGEHNKENILSAITVSKLLKIETEFILNGIKSFKGLPHRMEMVRELKKRRFFNDSKATTSSAVRKSISGFENIILIMGGRDKGLDYSELNEVLNKRVKTLILTGELKEKIKEDISYPEDRIYIIDDFTEAVQKAYEVSKEGDHIILSPGGTSYDRFRNFEERGETFKRIVNQLS
ncbi:MAG: UDP-N-acetylmuramoyl-L-alanine--D-glutamate ligase [Spirochaetes bacterium]|nr:UDP-N-acetylmuramoyl-L-alanine--D-glutamate ligase [Spirochaetota bacterium]